MSKLVRVAYMMALLPIPATAQQAAPTPSRIAVVEQGLTSAVVLAGTPAPRRTIEAEMRRLNVPGVSVAVLHGGIIEWSKGYGITRAGGPSVTPYTLFQAGSISKPITALAALRLVQQHHLTLDGSVNAQLRGWKLPTPPGEHVTLRELLSHTAGTTVHGFPGYAAGITVPSVDDVLAGRAPANTKPVVVDTKPGTMWRYSGGGYTVIQKLIGDVTGRPFTEVLRDEVLQPAGMTRSSFAQPLDAASLATAAWPHDGSGKPVPGGPHTYPELAAAGLWSTPSDLLRFTMAVRDSARGEKDSILAQSLATVMLTPGKGEWGLGVEVHPTPADRAFAHGGSNEGYENFMVAYTESGDGVAVMTNGAQGAELGSEITRSVAATYGWPSYHSIERASVPIPADIRARLIGTYAVSDLGSFSITANGPSLAISLKEGVSEPLYASAPDSYFVLSTDLVLRMNNRDPKATGRLVMGSFDWPFARETDAKP
ncbi:serine hydrolase [Sphingomonas sp. H160509]|uniref:serine hydrolase domain-containing protein n=1 Tax=Sphingomonas sp. H160509 TaxID=2955313 RepID=UPI002097F8FE|nr:serine hydrolase domain-containing protein [Sphingomonas sp. H160509]MDD1453188.1 serine hydrolase [Sphingomonas sp. H160509]